VGIGTTVPNTHLEVKGFVHNNTNISGTSRGHIHVVQDNSAQGYPSGITFGGDYSSNHAVASMWMKPYSYGSKLYFGTSNNYSAGVTNNSVVIDHEGKLGIGTESPNYPLEIKHGTPAINLVDSSSSGQFRIFLDGTDSHIQNHSSGGAINIATRATGSGGPTNRLTIQQDGAFTLKPGIGPLQIQNSDVSGQPGIQIYGVDENHGMFIRAGNDGALNVFDFHEYGKFRFFTGGGLSGQTERFNIQSDGNVGIGVTPNERLTVGGNIVATSHIYANNKTQIITSPWYNFGNNTGGSARLSTPIVHNESNMFYIKVTGFGYGSGGANQEYLFSGYAYSGSTLIAQGANTTTGGNGCSIGTEVRNGTTYVYIQISNGAQYYNHFKFEYTGWGAKNVHEFTWSKV
jgi:hypothetical protein